MTKHIERFVQKNLLQGTGALVDSCILNPPESCVPDKAGVRILRYVHAVLCTQIPDADWIVPRFTRPGVYPIIPTSKIWYLDKNKKNPVLNVRCHRIPIGPAFGITSHSSQGPALKDTSIDLIANDPFLCYVAIRRVCSSSDLVIYGVSPKKIFQRGDPLGPSFLLKKLREKNFDLHNHKTPCLWSVVTKITIICIIQAT